MEDVAKWLAMMGAMSDAAAAECRTCAQLAAELHDGVALATVALKLRGRPSSRLVRRAYKGGNSAASNFVGPFLVTFSVPFSVTYLRLPTSETSSCMQPGSPC